MLNAMTIEPFKCCPLTCVHTQPHGTTNKPQWRSRIIGWNVRRQEVLQPCLWLTSSQVRNYAITVALKETVARSKDHLLKNMYRKYRTVFFFIEV